MGKLESSEVGMGSFVIGMFVGALIILAIMFASTAGDVVKLDSQIYVNVNAGNGLEWYEINPTQPVTFSKTAVVDDE